MYDIELDRVCIGDLIQEARGKLITVGILFLSIFVIIHS
jgi:hypothetical protein